MDFAIADALRGDILWVTFTGNSTTKNAEAMTRRYFDIVLRSGARKVLADIRQLKGRLPEGETYFLIRNLPVRPVPAGIRTAIVDAKENRNYVEFLETTAANAGVQFKCFFEDAAARSWLEGAGTQPDR